jgi:hypothetical protein
MGAVEPEQEFSSRASATGPPASPALPLNGPAMFARTSGSRQISSNPRIPAL